MKAPHGLEAAQEFATEAKRFYRLKLYARLTLLKKLNADPELLPTGDVQP